MVDPTADVAFSTVESTLYNNVQALLKGMNSRSASQKGMLRWSLQQRLESDPSWSVSLVQVLVKELDKKLKRVSKISKTRSYLHVIPVLNTLNYVVIQSGAMIPTSVYQTVHECLMKLLILPSPYSAVALSTLRSIKMEMTTPGSLYQTRVVAEQNLKTEPFTWQEKVFVLADPAVFSPPLEVTVRAHFEVSSSRRNTLTVEKNVVLRVLQAGLGTTCQSSRLAQALQALGDQMVEKYFQKVVLAVEQSLKRGADGRANYLNKLQDIYRDILTASKEDITEVDHGSVCSTAMPFPEMNFHLWRSKEDLRTLLSNFLRRCCRSSADEEEGATRLNSVQSDDSERTEKDLKDSDTQQHLVRKPISAAARRKAFSRKTADKLAVIREKIEAFPGSSPVLQKDRRRHTARVVVMGDDRVLGRLAQAYHSIREERCNLIKRLNLQLYYIPVTDVEPSLSSPDSPCQDEGRLSLASSLGRVDPWYNNNINSLGAAISKLARVHPKHHQPSEKNTFLLDSLCYYLRCGTQPVNLPLYSVKMTRSRCGVSSVVEDVFVSHLEADILEFRHLKGSFLKEPSVPRRRSAMEVLGSVISVRYTMISLSKREVEKGDAPMTCGVVITSEPAAEDSGEDYLTVRFDSVTGHNTKIQTQNISIRTLEHRMFSVHLDRDSRRTYTDVQRIEISPCLDSGCCIRNERDLSFSKYLDQVVSLPINTFSGVAL